MAFPRFFRIGAHNPHNTITSVRLYGQYSVGPRVLQSTSAWRWQVGGDGDEETEEEGEAEGEGGEERTLAIG